MLDPDVPPEVEGNTDGGVGVVHPAAEAAVAVPQWAAIVRIMEASTPPPWTTATELTCKGAKTALVPDVRDPGLEAPTSRPIRILSLAPVPRTRPLASSLLWMTCFS